MGRPVVADSVNPLNITRAAWRDVAESAGARFVEIEVICSDSAEHRQRVERRVTNVPGLRLPTWDDVTNRAYESWEEAQIVIDTAHETVDSSLAKLENALKSTEQTG